MVSDCYVKYEETEFINQLSCKISEIMGKQILNGRLAAILNFISAKFVIGYPCVRHYYYDHPKMLFYVKLEKIDIEGFSTDFEFI